MKGISYKQGLIPAMLVDIATKNQEWSQNSESSSKESSASKVSKTDLKSSSNVEKKNAEKSSEKVSNMPEVTESPATPAIIREAPLISGQNDRLEKAKAISVIEKKVGERKGL